MDQSFPLCPEQHDCLQYWWKWLPCLPLKRTANSALTRTELLCGSVPFSVSMIKVQGDRVPLCILPRWSWSLIHAYRVTICQVREFLCLMLLVEAFGWTCRISSFFTTSSHSLFKSLDGNVLARTGSWVCSLHPMSSLLAGERPLCRGVDMLVRGAR